MLTSNPAEIKRGNIFPTVGHSFSADVLETMLAGDINAFRQARLGETLLAGTVQDQYLNLIEAANKEFEGGHAQNVSKNLVLKHAGKLQEALTNRMITLKEVAKRDTAVALAAAEKDLTAAIEPTKPGVFGRNGTLEAYTKDKAEYDSKVQRCDELKAMTKTLAAFDTRYQLNDIVTQMVDTLATHMETDQGRITRHSLLEKGLPAPLRFMVDGRIDREGPILERVIAAKSRIASAEERLGRAGPKEEGAARDELQAAQDARVELTMGRLTEAEKAGLEGKWGSFQIASTRRHHMENAAEGFETLDQDGRKGFLDQLLDKLSPDERAAFAERMAKEAADAKGKTGQLG